MKMQKIIMLIHHRCLCFMFDQTTMARQEQQKSGSKCHRIPAFMCGRPWGNGSDNSILKECRAMNLLRGETSPMLGSP